MVTKLNAYNLNSVFIPKKGLIAQRILVLILPALMLCACGSETLPDPNSDDEYRTPRKTDQSANGNNNKTAFLSWSAPMQRENGQSLYLYEIASYQLEITADDNSFHVIENITEDGSGSQTYSFEVKPRTTYTLAITTRDIDGLYSDTFTATIDQMKPGKK